MSDEPTPMQRTPLYPEHRQLGAKMIAFHGWEMPVYYSSILDEHRQVRTGAGLFDVSHMGQVFVSGPGARDTLNRLLVSDIGQVATGRACYSLMLNEQGGILDDVIVFCLGEARYLVIVNCANRETDVAWMQSHRLGQAQIDDRSDARSILAIQGPQAGAALGEVIGASVGAMGRFDIAPLPGQGPEAWMSRTGYTGSDGFELFVPNAIAVDMWRRLLDRAPRVQPIGLGARDTLRLEAGLRLCGTDMDATTTPFDADLGWTVALSKSAFIGRDALVAQKAAGVTRKLVGLTMESGPVPRHGCAVSAAGRPVGTVTSGTFSLMLNKPIGMASVERGLAAPGTALEVTIRTTNYPATVVKLPFWRPTPAVEPIPAQVVR